MKVKLYIHFYCKGVIIDHFFFILLHLYDNRILNICWIKKGIYIGPGWEFYHEKCIRAASTSDFWERVTGKEGVKKRWGFPLLLLVILFKGLNLDFTTFVENSVWVFFYTKIWFIGLRSRASLSISTLSGRRGRYAHACGICAPFYCISLKII